MTLIAAFSGAGGIALFSDSQETVAGYAKKRVSKIEIRPVRDGNDRAFTFAIAGSGNAVHVDRLRFELEGELEKLKKNHGLPAIHETLDRTTLKYFQERIWVRQTDRPDVEMLVIVHYVGGAAEMFHLADGTAIWIPGGHKCIGIGSYLAEYLLEKFAGFGVERDEMIGKAAYVLSEVKEHVDGVGLDSVICLFRRDGEFDYIEECDLEGASPLLGHFNRLLGHVFDCTFDTTPLASQASGISSELRRLSGGYQKWLKTMKDDRNKLLYEHSEFMGRMWKKPKKLKQ
jgi:20S proteasome alpha/beta subunit